MGEKDTTYGQRQYKKEQNGQRYFIDRCKILKYRIREGKSTDLREKKYKKRKEIEEKDNVKEIERQ